METGRTVVVSGECSVCGDPKWTRRVPLSHAPKEVDLTERKLPSDAEGHRLCISEDQLYIHLVRD